MGLQNFPRSKLPKIVAKGAQVLSSADAVCTHTDVTHTSADVIVTRTNADIVVTCTSADVLLVQVLTS